MECISLCAWHFSFVYFVSQCIHALIHPYTSYRFHFRNLFMETRFYDGLSEEVLHEWCNMVQLITCRRIIYHVA